MGPFILVDTPLLNETLCFDNPHRILRADTFDELKGMFEALEEAQSQGLYAAGFMAYEAGYGFEERLKALAPACDGPLALFGLFEAPQVVDWNTVPVSSPDVALVPLWTLDEYRARFERCLDYIRAGDTYQINLTFPLEGHYQGDPLILYAGLRRRQPTLRSAFVQFDQRSILSLSPELFFEVEGQTIRTRPMKGTAPRGLTRIEDDAHSAMLQASAKNRAENVMIVDMLRNDLSRLTQPGAVHVSDLFSIESYPSLFQMTSGIEARFDRRPALSALFAALFPCASVTGAPKIRAMEIIRELEVGPRGAYCGAIGYIAPSGDMHFNVAIRTLTLDADGRLTMPVGSGVVFESEVEEEYRECLLKARFLRQPPSA